jgi:hypothetical protein
MNNLSVIPSLIALTLALSAGAQSDNSRIHEALRAQAEAITPSAGDGNQKAQKESPFACVPEALSPAERKRHFDELGPMLRKLSTGIRELKDGYAFEFPSDRKTFDLVSEWAIQEQLCCPFFEITVRLGREGGPLSLILTGRKGTKEFVRDDFGPWFKESKE